MLSRTVTLKLACPRLPRLSLAVTCTTVVPSGKVLPLTGSARTSTGPSTASLALTAKLTTAPSASAASATMSAGTVTTGPVLSPTVTVKLPAPVFPAASVARIVTVVTPRGKTVPLFCV